VKSLLVHIETDDQMEARLAVALDLAREFGAHVTCLQATQLAALAVYSDMGAMMASSELIARLDAVEKQTRDRVEAHMTKEDVPWSYVRVRDDVARAILHHSQFADLIVMTRQSPHSLGNTMLLGDVLMQADVPLLVLPDPAHEFDLSAPAMIAWNSSHEAARAIRRALPMLRRASKVHLVSIKEEKQSLLPSKEASQYLSRHGIPSELHELPSSKAGIADTLLAKAKALKAAYVVVGAFGHSRAREFFFGGVSRDFLKSASLPLVVSH
jgi:nucleotide-binding universal stress UspA family protein